MDKQQREYFLQQQLKSIKDELGGDPNERELRDLQKRAEEMNWPETAKDSFQRIFRNWSACIPALRIIR